MKKSTIIAIAAVTSAVVATGIAICINATKRKPEGPHRIIIGGSLDEILKALHIGCEGNCDECEEQDECEFCETEKETEEQTEDEQKSEPKQSFADAKFYE